MNLVVYVADALRVDHVGCYGAEQVATPTIDELAAGGVRFDQAISAAPWTAPSTTSMITGLYPHRHGYLHWDAELDPALPTLFTVAAAYGYETGSFVFDERYLFRDFADANVAGTSERLDGAVEWLRERGSRPFCLWFHSWTTHMPYGVLHSERKEWRRAKEDIITGIQSGDPAALDALHASYREAVEREAETFFAGFLQALDDLGLREQTAIAFVADHGESWGERYDDKSEIQGTYHMHGADLYDEVVRVPLILAAPGLEPAVVSSQVSLVDLMPTLARARRRADRRPRRKLGAAARPGVGDRRSPGTRRRHRQGGRLAARPSAAAVEAHGSHPVGRRGGLPASTSTPVSCRAAQTTCPASSESSSTRSWKRSRGKR